MSHKKVQQLANKFANTLLKNKFQKIADDQFSENFFKKIRTALNEIEGDLVVLKYRNFNRAQWKELGDFWQTCNEINKYVEDATDGIKEFTDFLKEKKAWLAKIIPAIDQHLKSTEVDFAPGAGLLQARADGLKELIKVIEEGNEYIQKNISTRDQLETWKPPSKDKKNLENKTFISSKR